MLRKLHIRLPPAPLVVCYTPGLQRYFRLSRKWATMNLIAKTGCSCRADALPAGGNCQALVTQCIIGRMTSRIFSGRSGGPTLVFQDQERGSDPGLREAENGSIDGQHHGSRKRCWLLENSKRWISSRTPGRTDSIQVPYGESVEPAQVAAALEAHPDISAVSSNRDFDGRNDGS
jgi:hypothetical protein